MEFSDNLKSEILKKLTHKSPKPPARRTCRSRLELASNILSAIGSDPSPATVALAIEIVKRAQIYLMHAEFPVMDRLILRIVNRVFSSELLEYVRGESDEIVAGVCYVKYRHLGVVDERLFRVSEGVSGEIKRKIDQILFLIGGKTDGGTSATAAGCIKGAAGCTKGAADSSLGTSSCIKRTPDCIKDAADSSLENSDHIKRTPNNIKETHIKPVFPVIKNSPINWNNFSLWPISHPSLKHSILLINNSSLKDARTLLLSLVNSTFNIKAVAYNLLAYVHLLLLEFQESVFYLGLLLEITSASDWLFTFHCLLCIERLAELHSLAPLVCINYLDMHNNDKLENKLIMRQQLGTSFQRINLFSSTGNSLSTLAGLSPGLAILFIFASDGLLFIYNALFPDILLKVPWDDFVSRFNEIMHKNHLVLSMGATTPQEKHHWWDVRIKLDKELGELISEFSSLCRELGISASTKLLLILEDSVAFFPFESAFDMPAVRVLSRELSLSSSSPINSVFYLLDPANNLKNTRDTIFEYFSIKNFDRNFLKGVVGRSLSPTEVALLGKSELFMYFGHGTGKRHFDVPDSRPTGSRGPAKSTRPAALFLFGCSSTRLLHVPNFKANGFCLRYMKKGRTLLGNLWDVTDKDLDRFTIAFLNDFFDGKDLLEAIYDNRDVCKLRYLNQSALVVYGYFSRV